MTDTEQPIDGDRERLDSSIYLHLNINRSLLWLLVFNHDGLLMSS